jgi:hypothetical protein
MEKLNEAARYAARPSNITFLNDSSGPNRNIYIFKLKKFYSSFAGAVIGILLAL